MKEQAAMGRNGMSVLPHADQGDGRGEEPEWRAWMQDLGRRHRRLREFLGLSQEQLARLAGVSQGAVSRLETGRGLATPLLIVLKINGALGRQLRRLDPTLLSADLVAALDLQGPLMPASVVHASEDPPLADDARLGELVGLYRETHQRHRPSVLAVLRAMVAGLKRAAP